MAAEPVAKLVHPIPHDDTGGLLYIFGDAKNASKLIITCAGYPDDHAAFVPLASNLVASSQDCLVGVSCIPGFDDRPEKPWTDHCKDGYSFQEWTVALKEAVKTLRLHSTNPEATLTFIAHDWGSLLALFYTHSCLRDDLKELLPDQLVLLDVLLFPHPKMIDEPKSNIPIRTRLYQSVALLSYQVVLASLFFLQRYVSRFLAVIYYGLSFLLLGLVGLIPVTFQDMAYHRSCPVSRQLYRSLYMAYPYFNLWKAILTGKTRTSLEGAHLPLDLVKTPILYMYGANKRFHFHSYEGLAILEGQADMGHRSRVVRVQGAGHWLHIQQQETCLQEIVKFLKT